ncbi:hypothetical protein Esti_002941 [Eimeria stiedai]
MGLAAGRAAAAALLLPALCLCCSLQGLVLFSLAAANESEAAGAPPSAAAVEEALEATANAEDAAAAELGQDQQEQQQPEQQQQQKGIKEVDEKFTSTLSPVPHPLPLRQRSADEVDGMLPPLEVFFVDEAPQANQPSQRGSGEKYGLLLSKGKDLQGLPDTHPARVHADSRSARRKSFHLILAGVVLATAYLLSYYYHTWGSGVGTHAERHIFALNRVSSPTSAMLLVLAWRLWLGLIVSGLVTLALDTYRFESAISRRRKVVSKRLVNHWELLVGPPLLLLLLLSGCATRQFPLESSSAIAGAKGTLGSLLAHSGPAFESFMLDAVSQIPFGLAMVGAVELMLTLVGAVLRSSQKNTRSSIRKFAARSPHESEEGSSRAGSVGPSPIESEFPLDRTETRSNNSRRRNRRERSRRRRSQSAGGRRVPTEENRPQEGDESSKSSRSRRSYNRRFRTVTGKGFHGRHASVRPNRAHRRPGLEPVEESEEETRNYELRACSCIAFLFAFLQPCYPSLFK